jgi:uncharacterized protein YndB with AHSA1/START domain
MATESFEVSRIIPATPERIYSAWLDSNEHSKFTGTNATVDPTVGGRFTASDGYIEGKNLELEPNRRIVQSWWTTEFPEGSPPSRVEILLEPAEGGTQVRLIHTELPEGQGDAYRKGWTDYYFDPMTEYFSASIGSDTASADTLSDDEVTPAENTPSMADEPPEMIREEGGDEEDDAAPEVTPLARPVKKPAKKAAAKKKPAAKAKPKAKKAAAKPAKKAAKPAKPAKKAAAKPAARKAAAKGKKAAKPKKSPGRSRR